jgi:digeranylgeranylglycerophospholipid reductase
MVCAQYLLAGVEIDPACNAYTIGNEVAPGGYAWVFPKGEGKANVGLGAQANLWGKARAYTSPALQSQAAPETVAGCLTRFIEANPHLAKGYPVSLIVGNVPVAASPARLVIDGFMLVGDAARQVDPLTGGGITNAMTAGQLAGQVAVEAVASGDTSAGFLSRYEEQWEKSIGRKNRRNYRLRERFAPEQRAEEGFLRAFALAASG